jgi:dipeptidase D
MMSNVKLFPSALILSALLAISIRAVAAKPIPNSSAEFMNQCKMSASCELNLFLELSKTYRPSGEEDELRQYVLAVKAVSEKEFWKTSLESFQDPAGNLLIRLPATGRFTAQKSMPSFALQSHMDMVLAYSDAKPGENIKPYFKNGVEIEEKEGWLQAKDHKTTLGADNGIGVAIAMKYLIDPSIDHPPLELIFTVQEETGLIGAFASQLPLQSKKMLCLDGMTPEPGYIIAGSQGGTSNDITATAVSAISKNAKSSAVLKIAVSKLAGGHSGGDIYRNHLNAIKVFAEVGQFVSARVPSMTVKSLVAGDRGIFNKIPNIFQAELLIPSANATASLTKEISDKIKLMLLTSSDDQGAQVEVNIAPVTTSAPLSSTTPEMTQSLLKALMDAPNGVIDVDPAFYNGIFTSTNLSYLEISSPSASEMLVDFGHLTRGFNEKRIDDVVATTLGDLRGVGPVKNFSVVNKADYDPWMEPDTSTLLNETLSISGVFSKKFYVNGGLEPSAFKTKFPGLEVVALGPLITMAHSTSERLKVDSIQPTVAGIRAIIQNQK